MKTNKSLIGVGLLTSIAASLCCITPVLAFLIAGVSGVVSPFSWLEPARPYLIGITVFVLGFAWYQKLKPKKIDKINCDCEEDEKPSFLKSKIFLGIVSIFASLMLLFPYYSGVFSLENNTTIIIVNEQNIVEAKFSIEGMTCMGCENHVTHSLESQKGVIEAHSSYKEGSATVKFDKTKTSIKKLAQTVEKETGYKVSDYRMVINE